MGVEVYVGQISGAVTETEMQKLFSLVGTVESIHLVKDSDSGAFRGCGYVRMGTEEEAREAINLLNGAMLGDRLIVVKACLKQNDKKTGSWGGGSGGADGRAGRGTKRAR